MTGEVLLKNGHNKFISGVVEGFYGRPWSAEQRKLLFTWMQRSGLNTYMYAPKDDYKHRAYWRDLYSVEEAENLSSLINCANEKGVTFVYAISPGLDISFSNSKDVQALKRKLEQVATFGCDAFAVLFDDIDPELSEADRSAFQSFGSAQVSVSNEIYEHLNQPKLFLFCPTEYCASRAIPDVSSSEYLNTLGSKLLPGIDVMWTGPRVVSRRLTIQSLEEIASVLKRPAVIWDNIHANDYDPRRIFLGPYDGRSPEIIPYINGVMTNPNTEFEANFMAIHTLGQWANSNPDGVKKDIISRERLSPIAADIKLETESDFSSDEDLPSQIDLRYQPKIALKVAMSQWIAEIQSLREPPRQPYPRVIPTFLPPDVPQGQPPHPTTPCVSPTPGPPVIFNPTTPALPMPSAIPSSAPGNPAIPPGVSPFPLANIQTPLDIPSAAPPCLDPADLEYSASQEAPYMPASPPAGLPLPDIIKTCLTPASTTVSITSSGVITPVTLVNSSHQLPEPIPTFLQPPSVPVNSLYEMPSSSDIDSLSDSTSGAEPMEVALPSCSSDIADSSVEIAPQDLTTSCAPLTNNTPNGGISIPILEKENSSDSLMQVETSEMASDKKEDEGEHPVINEDKDKVITEEDGLLLADIFYMPFEHGAQGLFLLQRLYWLRSNCHCISKKQGEATNSFEATEWHHLAEEFFERCDTVIGLIAKLVVCPNKSFMCDLYSYVWDLVSILKICKAYVQWLAFGLATHPQAQQTFSCVTWFTKSYREAFLSGDQEPWIFRGGLQSELQRLLPVDSAHDLFYIKPPDYIVTKSFTLRPYQPIDEDVVYQICLKTCDDGMDGTDVFPDNPQLMGDKLLGKLATLTPKYGFVIEDEVGVCGYVLAAPDAKELAMKSKIAWVPAMCEKYPLPPESKDTCSPADEVMQSFHGEQPVMNEEVYTLYPSVLRLDILPNRIEDPAIPRRLLACVLSALKSCGSKGVHCELSVGDKFMVDFYAKLGFSLFASMDEPSGDDVYLGRSI